MPPLCRAWCYTLNNPTEDEIEIIKRIPDIKVHVAAHEVGDSGTPHIQGYIRFEKPQRMTRIKRFLPRAHVEIREGTETQAYNYCLKQVPEDESTIVVKQGSPSEPVKSTALNRNQEAAEVITEIEEGTTYWDIRKKHKVFCFWHRRQVLDYIADERINSRHPDFPNAGPV